MKQNNYKSLGQYIQLVDERNRDGAISNLVGVSFEKKIIPSIANTIGTDLSNYRIIKPGQFAYCPVTSRNGERISIALYKGDEKAILSVAYSVFEITKPEELDSEYLLLWVSRPEFDRYARFMSHGSVRELFSWEEMCNVLLPVPPIEEQRRIVAEYQTVERRIKNNEAMIQKLEETAQAIYHHTFVEGIDENNLPEGWMKGCIGDIMRISSGKSAKDKVDTKTEFYKYPVAGASGIIGYSSLYNTENKLLTTGRVGTLGVINKYNEAIWCADNVLIAESDFYEYSFNILKNVKYEEIAKGGVQALLTQGELNNYPILVPNKEALKSFETIVAPIYAMLNNYNRELSLLRTLQSLLTSKLA